MFSVLSIIFFFAIARWKQSAFLKFFALNFFIFSFVTDGLFLGYFTDQFVYGYIKKDGTLIYIWFCYLIAFIVFALTIHPDKTSEQVAISKTYSDFVMSFFFIISLLVTIMNVIRAGNIAQLFLTPRIWEMNFGRYPILNYLYFLHVLSAFIAIVQFKIYGKKWYLFIFVASVLLSIFHGIKMSIAHAIIIPSFGFFILNNYRLNKFISRIAGFFVLLILCFFIFVRGGDVDGFIGYITSGSVNSIYKIQNQDILFNSPVGTIIPDISSMFSWIVRRYTESDFVSNNPGVGFVLNEKYNTFHPISDSYITTISFYILPLILAFTINRVKNRKCITLPTLFIESFLLYSCFMFFWSWIFWQIKILYLIVVIAIVYIIEIVKVMGAKEITVSK